MKLEMELNNLTRADLARKLGISRARVTQFLNLLRLPKELKDEIEEMGDNWGRRLVTERMLRRLR
ncbi:MAG: helix-turn-helix domain-containing protein [Candidatus Sabulitectum sp.]|nr:helix-turn-helix domain-containing protein [Candidatus Sabulitectum sp.]